MKITVLQTTVYQNALLIVYLEVYLFSEKLFRNSSGVAGFAGKRDFWGKYNCVEILSVSVTLCHIFQAVIESRWAMADFLPEDGTIRSHLEQSVNGYHAAIYGRLQDLVCPTPFPPPLGGRSDAR